MELLVILIDAYVEKATENDLELTEICKESVLNSPDPTPIAGPRSCKVALYRQTRGCVFKTQIDQTF
jgi:hypothetical protein